MRELDAEKSDRVRMLLSNKRCRTDSSSYFWKCKCRRGMNMNAAYRQKCDFCGLTRRAALAAVSVKPSGSDEGRKA